MKNKISFIGLENRDIAILVSSSAIQVRLTKTQLSF
jgi:hypothetical protein